VLAARANGQIEGKPLELVSRALSIEPNNVMALSLAATAAYNRRDMSRASELWNRALALVPPESEDAKWLRQALAEVPSTVGSNPAPGPATSAAAVAHTASAISGRVALAPALAGKVKPTDTVFVFARLPEGPRMPLAVQRAQVADLPLAFTLDDGMAMSPQFKLSGANEVRIEARISSSGSATPQPGDLIGAGPVVKPGARNVVVTIDAVRP
jgi:cytochrome c-type biogenesis protein CcmH